jgi:hypothetical protein
MIRRFKEWRRAKQLARLVRPVIAGVASLELLKGQSRTLAPVPGMHGDVVVSGNGLPEFRYMTFDKALMEFITVKANISLPNKIELRCFHPIDNNPNMQIGTPAKFEYTAPFMQLMRHLAAYFPLVKDETAVKQTEPEKQEPGLSPKSLEALRELMAEPAPYGDFAAPPEGHG